MHFAGVPWRDIGDYVGQRNISVTADTYTRSMSDRQELDFEPLLVLS